MKTSEVEDTIKIIVKFIQDISKHETSFIEELPDVWGSMLNTLNFLSNTAQFLDAAKNFEFQEDLEFYNSMLIANGKVPTGRLPDRLLKNDRNVDFSRFVDNKIRENEKDDYNRTV